MIAKATMVRFVGALLGLGIALLVLYCLPLPAGLTDRHYSTVVYSQDGMLLAASIAEDDQWRFPAETRLPKKYVTALLHFEDRRFFNHPGIDPLALARAIGSNLSSGKIVSGASTITMQLARLLSGDQPRTYWQKLKEAMLAVQLELHFSKREILNHYAAHAPFGGNNVGLAAAYWRYYGKDMAHMTWAEAALFAVLPNAPSSISPGKNRQKLINKRNRLLDRLHGSGALGDLDLKLAKLEPLPDRPKSMPDKALHLLATLKQRFPEQHSFVTTLDSRLQEQTDLISATHIRRLGSKNINNLSVLVLDNFEKKVLAYQGNRVFNDNADYATAVDIIQRPRSSGSLFKPFLYAAIIQSGQLTPESLVLDVPSYYNGYSPENYDRGYRGAVTARQALIQSLNVPSVRLLQEYGVGLFKEDLEKVGISSLFRKADDYGLSLILGGAESTLWEITNAYAGLSLSAYGRADEFHQARLLQGETVAATGFPLKQGAAWLTLKALTQVKRPGVAAAWEAFASSQQIAWKTGTSYGWHDAWAIGSNGRYTVGVWAGNANSEEGRDLTGTRAAAPVMLDVFRLLANEPWPATPVQALKTYRLCKTDGYLPAAGCELHSVQMPREADFTTSSPYQRRIHVDPATGQRVRGHCESVARMQARTYFVLPPVAEYYYRKTQPAHASLPAWRADCADGLRIAANEPPMQLEYPVEGARIKIPVQLDGELGRTVFRAQHRDSDSVLHWHLNDEYLGETRYIHEVAVAVNAGWHRLVLVDETGHQLQRWFRVL